MPGLGRPGYGLTAALYGEITIERGRVKQGNFDDYPMLRLGEMPVVGWSRRGSREQGAGSREQGAGPRTARGSRQYTTSIDPLIPAWLVSTYVYLPTAVNVAWPVPVVRLSKLAGRGVGPPVNVTL